MKKFNPKHLHKLDNPERMEILPPDLPVTLFGFQPGQHVVDFGCGSGYFTVDIAKAVGSEGIVYAVDQHPEMLDAAKERISKNTLSNIRFLQNTENDLPIPSNSVHDVFMATVFHELESPEHVLPEVFRVLLPGGRLLILDWLPLEEEWGPRLHHRIAPESVIEAAEAAGLEFCGDVVQHHSFYLLTFEKPY